MCIRSLQSAKNFKLWFIIERSIYNYGKQECYPLEIYRQHRYGGSWLRMLYFKLRCFYGAFPRLITGDAAWKIKR